MKLLVIVVLSVGVMIGMACRSNDRTTKKPALSTRANVSESTPVVDSIDEAGLKNLTGGRKGKVLFLNIWATWCAPCVEEFPDLVKLAQAYSDSAVEVVGISADYPDEIQSKIVPFLKKANVPFRVYVATFAHQEDFINAVNQSWSGALPASLIYDTEGHQRYFHVGQGTFVEFKNQIDKIIGKEGKLRHNVSP